MLLLQADSARLACRPLDCQSRRSLPDTPGLCSNNRPQVKKSFFAAWQTASPTRRPAAEVLGRAAGGRPVAPKWWGFPRSCVLSSWIHCSGADFVLLCMQGTRLIECDSCAGLRPAAATENWLDDSPPTPNNQAADTVLYWIRSEHDTKDDLQQQTKQVQCWRSGAAALAGGSPKALLALLQCSSKKHSSRMVRSLYGYSGLRTLDLTVTVTGKTTLSKLGAALGGLPSPLQQLSLALMPAGSTPPASFDALLEHSQPCLSRLKGLRVQTYGGLAAHVEALVAVCSELRSLEVSLSPTPGELNYICQLQKLQHLLLLELINSSGSGSGPSTAAAALPGLLNLDSGGGSIPYGHVGSLVSKMKGVKRLSLKLFVPGPPGGSVPTALPPDFGQQVFGPLSTIKGLSHIKLHVYAEGPTASGHTRVELPVSLAEVVAYMPSLMYLEVMAAPEGKLGHEELDGLHGQRLATLVLSSGTPSITSSSSSTGAVLDLGALNACPGLVSFVARNLLGFTSSYGLAAALGHLTRLTRLDLGGPPAVPGQRDIL